MRRTKHALAIVAFTLVSCSTQAVPVTTPTANFATLRVYTTTATLPLLTDLAARYAEVLPTVSFETESANYQLTLEHLLKDETPFFFTNHLPVESLLWAAPLGQDGIAVIVHPSNPVASLTTE
ncbi:MAG TPA: hypothetical protein VHO69_16990, partial [Phototrophicaceae bacterium]|nr:hypothetical protein [Phototrophicaceae bacterium]